MRKNLFIHKTDFFIETGSYSGDGIQLALNSGFSKIYSIELSPQHLEECKRRFSGEDRVELILGDSSVELRKIMEKNPSAKFTFWLDGHYSGGTTAKGEKETPLREELESILSRDISGEIIYIDDMRQYRTHHEITLKDILDLIEKYKPFAKYWFEPSDLDPEDQMVIEY